MLRFIVPGDPVAFARAGTNGKRRYTPPKQAAAMRTIQNKALQAFRGREFLEGALRVEIEAVYTAPQSWSAKKKAETEYKTSKPDVDNLCKLILDSLTGIIWKDDQIVSHIEVTKRYGETPYTSIFVDLI
jgi:Holliday junction resolvase RusA-like endonuclease